jgi:arylsulfatase A-like enzyme
MDVHTLVKTGIRPEFLELFKDYGRDAERMYYLKVRQTSADLGRFIEALLGRPGYENTLVVILADHGEGLFDHPNIPNSDGHGLMLYESNMRVPLILCHLAGGLAPRQVEQEVRIVDLLPTLLDYLNIRVKLPGIVGKSLLPLIKGSREKIDLPEYSVAETRTQEQFKVAVYSRNWIYIENRRPYPGVNPKELQSRHGRQNGKWSDLINEKPEIAAGMAEFLKTWERKFPQAKPTSPKEKATKETIEQLKSLGYIR